MPAFAHASPATVAGLDGCPAGWVCVSRTLPDGPISACILPTIDALADMSPRPGVAMIDIPIGLADCGRRACDGLARRMLGGRRACSVFSAPIRPMLRAADYHAACDIGAATDGRRISRQSWHILPKIREVDAFLRADPGRADWLLEAHPEVSFQQCNHGAPLADSKKRPAGRAAREALVRGFAGAALETAKRAVPRAECRPDDLLDAFAALWTAQRVVDGHALCLPDPPEYDAHGFPMAIRA